MEIRRARPQRRWTTQRPDNQAKVQVGAMKHSRRANCVVPTNTSHHSTTRPRLCEGHASLTTPINSVKPDKGAARWRGLPHYQWTPPGAELGTSRMQFKNTSDVTLRTDKNRHPIRGELHAELGNDQQHTRTPGTADESHQGHHHTNFAHNLSWSLFKMRQKRCNSNDASSIFERDKGELRAKLLSIPHAPTKKRAATHGHSKQPSPHMLKSLYKTNTFCPPSKLGL